MAITPVDASAPETSYSQNWAKIQAEMGAKPTKQREVKKTLDKDDFLKIMVTQMKNQDPTKPFEADKLATEIAQITSVEQLGNVNKALKALENQNHPLERLTMANLIGKTVTVDRSRFQHAKGDRESIPYSLPAAAAKVRISIISDRGEAIRTDEIPELEAGAQVYRWDGLNDSRLDAKEGRYSYKIEAFGKDGRTINPQRVYKSQVIGVSYEKGEPQFLVKGVSGEEKVMMDDISMIETGSGGSAEAAAPANFIPAVVDGPQFVGQGHSSSAGPAMVSFEKGVGSKTMTPDDIEKGFPNGLPEMKKAEVETESSGIPNIPPALNSNGGEAKINESL